MAQASRNGSDLWLCRWVSRARPQQQGRPPRRLSAYHLPQDVALYLSVLLVFAACNALLTLIRCAVKRFQLDFDAMHELLQGVKVELLAAGRFHLRQGAWRRLRSCTRAC